MKITAFLLLAFCMQVSATTLAQTVTLSERKAPLEKVINEIKRQTGYSFFYNEDWLKQAQPVDIDIKNVPLDKALQFCFANQPIDYAVVNQTIVLKLKDKSSGDKLESIPSLNVAGRVTDSLGTPLIGATVANKTENKSVITNENGEFNIAASPNDVLSISYIGFKTVTIKFAISNSNYLNISLHPAIGGLKEVVVSTGFQNLPQERATGSFATVDNDLFNRKTSPDVLSRLEGVVSGLLVNRNINTVNNPNGIDISIRGVSTLFSNMQPLIVVDNFPYDGNIANINPNDIENITILKDAAAASIWGVQSGNGVIVITTKKGHRNQPLEIELNANVTISNKPDLFYNPNFLDSKDFISVEKSLFNQGFYDTQLASPNEPVVSPVVQILANERSGLITSDQAKAQINSLENNDVRNDLTKYFYQKSIAQQYAASFKGGGAKNDYLYSVGYDYDLSNLVGNKNDRLTLNAINNFYPLKNLQLISEIHYTQSNATSNSPVSNIYSTNGEIYPYAQLADKNGNALPINRDYNFSWITDPTAQNGYLDWQFRPLDELHDADNTSQVNDIRIITGIKYSILKGLNFDLRYDFEKSSSSYTNNYSASTYYTRNLINEFTDFTGSNPQGTQYPIPIGGILNQGFTDFTSNRVRGNFSYNNNWNSKNQISAILGAEIDQSVTSLTTPSTVYGYNKQDGSFQNVDFVDYYNLFPNLNASQIPNSEGFDTYTNRFVSYFTNIAYTYDNKYTISGSARIDKSNLFGVATNQKSAPLYSTGFSWDITKEKFYQVDWLPALKVKATFGYNGNLNNSATGVATIARFNNSIYSGLPYANIANPGNPDLRWEKDRQINLAVEFGLKNNLITGSLEYYWKDGTDLFGSGQLAPSTGNANYYGNVASTAGNGFDITLNVRVIKTNNFKWTSNLLLSYAIDKVTKYYQPFDAPTWLQSGPDAGNITPTIGKPIFAIYSFKSAGLTHDTGDPQGYLNGQLSKDYTNIIGNIKSVDSLKFWGSARPTTFGSWRNTFAYKGFTLSANIIYKFNYYFRRSSINYNSLYNNWQGNIDYIKRWQVPGDELKTVVPSMPTLANLDPNREFFYDYSEALVDKGDHIRLQDITIDYTLNNPHIFHNTFKRFDIFFNINNVGIIWRANHDGLDPDTYTNSYPTPRTYSVGIRSNF